MFDISVCRIHNGKTFYIYAINTIAHELNHARSFIAGGNAPEQGPRGGYAAGDALAEYVRGER